MAVIGFREVLPRTYQHKLGDGPTASRTFVATVDAPTLTSEVIASVGIDHGAPHPDYSFLSCETIEAEETDRHHVTLTYGYAISESTSEDPNQPPWAQPDSWSFGTTNSTIACTYYYPFAKKNDSTRTLANMAGDVFTGITRPEAELKITISGARLTIKTSDLMAVVNAINDDVWAGFEPRTVQCVGISATPDRLEFEGAVLPYWRINAELLYRPSTHDLWLPHVGWNVLEDGNKVRAYLYADVDGQAVKVPTPQPVALDMQGGFRCPPTP